MDNKIWLSLAYHFNKRANLYAVALIIAMVSNFVWFKFFDTDAALVSANREAVENSKQIFEEFDASLKRTALLKTELDKANACVKLTEDALKTKTKADCSGITVSGSTVSFDEPVKETFIPVAKASEYHVSDRIVWLTNSQGQSKPKAELGGYNFEGISAAHKIPIEYWYDAERKYKVKKEVALCIAWADSGLGRYLKSTNNIGNVGNNDRGDVVHFDSLQSGVEAVFKVLNNKYLKHKQSIGSLSPGGGGDKPYYATSKENWIVNVRNCLGVVHGQNISNDFTIRLKQAP